MSNENKYQVPHPVPAWEAAGGEARSSRANEAEELLAGWAEADLAPAQLRAISELIDRHAFASGEDPSAAQVLLDQLAGRSDELMAVADVRTLAQEVLDAAAGERTEALLICQGTYELLGFAVQPGPEALLSHAQGACRRAHALYASFARFSSGTSAFVDTAVELATNGVSVGSLDLAGIARLCERLEEMEADLRAAYRHKAAACAQREARAADVLAAMEVVGTERVATRIASHYGLRAQAMVLAEECCELGHAAARVARVAGKGEEVPAEVRAELLEEAADVLAMVGQLTWLVGIEPQEVERVMREKIVRTIVQGEVPFKADE